MFAKVFVLGRPGSGKTTAVHRLIELAERHRYRTHRMKDYEILYKMFKEDTERTQFRPADYGGFDVLDYSVFDVALGYLEENVNSLINKLDASSAQDGIITIEFARDDYSKALRNFTSAFLQDAYFLFVDLDLDTCIQRILSRVSNPPVPDRHYVSEYIMRKYYNFENWDYMNGTLRNEYGLLNVVDTYYNKQSRDDLLLRVSTFADKIFKNEFLLDARKPVPEQSEMKVPVLPVVSVE